MFSLTSVSRRLLPREGAEGEGGSQGGDDRRVGYSLGQNLMRLSSPFFLCQRGINCSFLTKEFEREVLLNSVELNSWSVYYLIPTHEIKIDSLKLRNTYVRNATFSCIDQTTSFI